MLLGDEKKIRHMATVNQIDLEGMPIINPTAIRSRNNVNATASFFQPAGTQRVQ